MKWHLLVAATCLLLGHASAHAFQTGRAGWLPVFWTLWVWLIAASVVGLPRARR